MSFWQTSDLMKLYCEVLCVMLYITENSFSCSIENHFNAVYCFKSSSLSYLIYLAFSTIWEDFCCLALLFWRHLSLLWKLIDLTGVRGNICWLPMFLLHVKRYTCYCYEFLHKMDNKVLVWLSEITHYFLDSCWVST